EEKRPVYKAGHAQRGGHEPHPRAQEARHEEEDGARDLAGLAEAVEEELVDGRAVVAVEGGDEEEGQRELGRPGADEELHVLPVLAIRGGGHRDDGDRADLGGQERETRGPPGNVPPREEEVGRVLLAARESAADGDEGDEGDEEDGVVGPGEAGAEHGGGHGLAPLCARDSAGRAIWVTIPRWRRGAAGRRGREPSGRWAAISGVPRCVCSRGTAPSARGASVAAP